MANLLIDLIVHFAMIAVLVLIAKWRSKYVTWDWEQTARWRRIGIFSLCLAYILLLVTARLSPLVFSLVVLFWAASIQTVAFAVFRRRDLCKAAKHPRPLEPTTNDSQPGTFLPYAISHTGQGIIIPEPVNPLELRAAVLREQLKGLLTAKERALIVVELCDIERTIQAMKKAYSYGYTRKAVVSK